MNKNQALSSFVKQQTAKAESSHDWEHVQRVLLNAKAIQKTEGGNLEVVEIACLLHDIADHKFHNNDFDIGSKMAYELVLRFYGDLALAKEVSEIVKHVSFKGANVMDKELSLEGRIVRDADRLDALGAIGIARTFTYGGHINQKIFNPESLPKLHSIAEEYARSRTHTIAHFYEKLLLLKDRMETATGKKMAEERHQFLCLYLETFFSEIGFINKSTDFDLTAFS